MYCIGCGQPLRVTSGPCSACRTDATGADLTETVRLEYGIGLPPRLETTEALVAFDRRYS